MKRIVLLCLILYCSLSVCEAEGDRTGNTLGEQLNRGMVAIHQGKGEVSVSWRLFRSDSPSIEFDLYRSTEDGKQQKLNRNPLKDYTFYTDREVDVSRSQRYVLYARQSSDARAIQVASYLLTPELASRAYLSIPLEPLAFDTAHIFQPNDASVGDLDGDGEMEIVIKRMGAFYACSQKGMCPHSMVLEAYKLDGKRLWQIDLGVNIRQGAQYFQFIVYDFDGDGCAEVALKTVEGTRFGDGSVIGDTDGDGITDYVIRDPALRTYGKILSGPEFFSVVEGKTGRELARGPYITRGRSEDWGDNYGNRVDRQLAAVGYFDGKHPGIFWGRGYNGRSAMQVWNFVNGKLELLWKLDTRDDPALKDYENQGNHNIRIADVDGDGKDEVIYGACAIDHDGSPLHTTCLGHGDALHLTDIDPSHSGLEVWQGHEYAPGGSTLRDACTGEILFRIPTAGDVGRAMCADIDPRYPGCEIWSSHSGGLYSCKGEKITDRIPSVNMAVWWDGDLTRELLDGVRIQKWTENGLQDLFDGRKLGVLSNNGTKANPCLAADILGDWREEVIWRSADNNELRIYLTPYETTYRFPTFWEDTVYRVNVALQNVGYNQPTHLGHYFGPDNDITLREAYRQAEQMKWRLQMKDSGKGDWQKQWFLDGGKASITNDETGLTFKAGTTPLSDADHAVLWTKQEFAGRVMLSFDFMRLDSIDRFVNIIYLLASGSGAAGYDEDISRWQESRRIPAMKCYFEHMNALHLSFAAFENHFPDHNNGYIRARRYLPERGLGLTGTALSPEYLSPMLFETGVPYRIGVIWDGRVLMMKVADKHTGRERYFRFYADDFPSIKKGRIGIRQMCTRASRYGDFRVWAE